MDYEQDEQEKQYEEYPEETTEDSVLRNTSKRGPPDRPN